MDHGVVHVDGDEIAEEVNDAPYHVGDVEGASPAHLVARARRAL